MLPRQCRIQRIQMSIPTISVLLMFGVLLFIVTNYFQLSHYKNVSIETELIDNDDTLRPLIFTIATSSYINFVKNWVLSLEKHEINDYMIICQDIKCKNELLEWSISLFRDERIEYPVV